MEGGGGILTARSIPSTSKAKKLSVATNKNGLPKIKSAQFNGNLGNRFKNNLRQNSQTTPQRTSDTVHTNNKTKANRTIRGIANLGKNYINVPKVLKTTAKLGAGVIGAGTLGTIGVAAGLASDDYADVAKYGLAGVAGGYAVGRTVGTSAANVASTAYNAPSNIKDTFEQGYYGSDYKRIKDNREYAKSKEIKEYYKDKYGSEWEEKYELGKKLKEQGDLDNQKDIDKAIKLVKDNRLSIKQASDLMLFRKKVGADFNNLTDDKKRKSIEKEASRLFGGDKTKAREIMKHLDSIR